MERRRSGDAAFVRGACPLVLETVRFCSLCLLPAGLLHLSLDGRFRAAAISGYILSAVAIALHLCEDWASGMQLHRIALWMITFGTGALTVACTVGLLREGREIRGGASVGLSRSRTPTSIAARTCTPCDQKWTERFTMGHSTRQANNKQTLETKPQAGALYPRPERRGFTGTPGNEGMPGGFRVQHPHRHAFHW